MMVRLWLAIGLFVSVTGLLLLAVQPAQALPARQATATPWPTRTPYVARDIPAGGESLPLPTVLPFLMDAASWAREFMTVVNENNILWVIVAIGIAGSVLAWVVHTVRNPPRF